jgi:hypothetical protein
MKALYAMSVVVQASLLSVGNDIAFVIAIAKQVLYKSFFMLQWFPISKLFCSAL